MRSAYDSFTAITQMLHFSPYASGYLSADYSFTADIYSWSNEEERAHSEVLTAIFTRQFICQPQDAQSYIKVHSTSSSAAANRWHMVKSILEIALDVAPSGREEILRTIGLAEPSLAEEVRALLDLEHEAESFLSDPVDQTGPSQSTELAEGQDLGKYRVVKLIGRGGMGSVYLGQWTDGPFQRDVAIKLARSGLFMEELVRRLKSEENILARLNHPNIVRLLDGGIAENGANYLVMEHIQGQRIDEYCNTKQLDVRDKIRLFLRVCSAIEFAHQQAIVHSDIKPANILVTPSGEPKLLDFGIAQSVNSHEDILNCLTTRLKPMTPEYASPEQVLGKDVTTTSDVYGLGILLCVLLTGAPPLRTFGTMLPDLEYTSCDKESDNFRVGYLAWHASKRARPLLYQRTNSISPYSARTLRRELGPDLYKIISNTLKSEPLDRYPSVRHLANDLQRFLDKQQISHNLTRAGYIKEWTDAARRDWLLIIIFLLSLMSLAYLFRRY